MEMDDDLYQQPSEMEQQRLQMARERSNKISKVLGDYLLKGYKMLGSTCNKCQTILLEDRQGEDYCVGCTEVDVMNHQPPDVTQVHHLPSNVVPSSSHISRPVERDFPTPREVNTTIDELDLARKYDSDLLLSCAGVGAGVDGDNMSERELIEISCRKLMDQIRWANECLANIGNNTAQRTEYVTLIKTCYETLQLLRPTSFTSRLIGRP